MSRNLIAALLVSVVAMSGCNGQPEAAPKAAAGETTKTAPGAKAPAQGMSANDLSIPPGSENANLPGSKAGG
jgi:hypothetical protein